VFTAHLYARVQFSCASKHTRPRVQRAPGIPCALSSEGGTTNLQNSGKSCRENGHVCFHVFASEAKQSTYPLAALWIASSQALLAMTAVDDLSAVA
jgi:hypothetical protein